MSFFSLTRKKGIDFVLDKSFALFMFPSAPLTTPISSNLTFSNDASVSDTDRLNVPPSATSMHTSHSDVPSSNVYHSLGNPNTSVSLNSNFDLDGSYNISPSIVFDSASAMKSSASKAAFSTIPEQSTCPYGCCEPNTISEYVFSNALIKGNNYDVIIKAFDKKYKFHKLFLSRSPYFCSLFSWSRNTNISSNKVSTFDSASDSDTDLQSLEDDEYRKTYVIPFDDVDSDKETLKNKQKSFELTISRLYGAMNLKEEYKIPYMMIEMGQYLAVNDVVCTATEHIIKNMTLANLAENLNFATNSDYGSASQRIIENGKGILCSDGWEEGPDSWDGIPASIIAEVVGEDYFFVPTEWDRCIFIIKLIERRLQANTFTENASTEVLRKVLNEKIHYCHMSPEMLQELEELCDVNGNHYVDHRVLHAALWQAVQLETVVTRSQDTSSLDGTIASPIEPSNKHKWFRVPSKDETLSGLPSELNKLLNNSLSTRVTNKLNSEDSKTTQGSLYCDSENEKIYNWTKIPPFRFSIAFANVSELPTDKRVYGKTFWYAGSYWNLYLQKSHLSSKNSFQVGVYLHRAHNGSSSTSSKSVLLNPDIYSNNVNYTSPTILPQRSLRNGALNNNLNASRTDVNDLETGMVEMSLSDDLPSSLNTKTPALSQKNSTIPRSETKPSIINYEDQRSAIKVYFIIFTPSRRAIPTITSFLSVPNDFSRSQSWGWKSNNMCIFNENGTFVQGQDPNLKFMILLGNV